MDASRLQREIQHYRHDKTRRKPASERVTILNSAIINKQAQVLEAFRSRRAADRLLLDLKVEVESIESAPLQAECEEAEADAKATPAVQHISLAQLQMLRLAARVSRPFGGS